MEIKKSTIFTVCMPVYNEEKSLIIYITEIVELLKFHNIKFNFSICDDSGSAIFKSVLMDHFKRLNVELTYYAWIKNRGAAVSMYRAGYNAVGEVLIFVDADGQFDPKDILCGIQIFNCSSGNRAVIFDRAHKSDTFIKVFCSKISSILGKFLLNNQYDLVDLNCALKIIPKNIFETLPLMARHLNYSFEMLFYLSKLNINLHILKCKSMLRKDGVSSVKLIRDSFSRLLFLLFLGFISFLCRVRVLDLKNMEEL